MTPKPTVQELQRNRSQYLDWSICPICRGGRGEIIQSLDEETGEHLGYAVRACPLCQGEKVIERVNPRQGGD